MRLAWISALAAVGLFSSVTICFAHEGHDHGPEAPAAPANVQPRGEAQSDNLEIVAIGQGNAIKIYLDRFKSNEPVAKATVEAETPDGPATAEPQPDGTYLLKAPWLAKGGHIDLIFTVTVDGEADVLTLAIDAPSPAATATEPAQFSARAREWLKPAFIVPLSIGFVCGVLVMAFGRSRSSGAIAAAVLLISIGAANAHEGHDHGEPKAAPQRGGDRALRQPDGVIFVPKPVQRVFGIRTVTSAMEELRTAIELPGRVIPDPSTSGFVQTAIGGRLSAPPGGFPRLGSKVKKDDVLAYVTPPIQAVDASDMRQRQGEIDQQIAIVERRVQRYQLLAQTNAVPRFQLEEAKLELEGLKERRAALERVRRDTEALVAPVDGVVAEGMPVAGQIAQSNSVVFQIVDPARLWIEALSFEAITDVRSASATTPNGKSLTLKFLGAGFTDRSQSVPVQFAVEGDTAGLRAGQLVNVFAEAGEARRGIAVPRTAVVRAANGQNFVFEHVTAERFAPRAVRVEPLDAERVLLLAGVEPGKRLVTVGAELLDQVR